MDGRTNILEWQGDRHLAASPRTRHRPGRYTGRGRNSPLEPPDALPPYGASYVQSDPEIKNAKLGHWTRSTEHRYLVGSRRKQRAEAGMDSSESRRSEEGGQRDPLPRGRARCYHQDPIDARSLCAVWGARAVVSIDARCRHPSTFMPPRGAGIANAARVVHPTVETRFHGERVPPVAWSRRDHAVFITLIKPGRHRGPSVSGEGEFLDATMKYNLSMPSMSNTPTTLG